jgi:hypothetical protein
MTLLCFSLGVDLVSEKRREKGRWHGVGLGVRLLTFISLLGSLDGREKDAEQTRNRKEKEGKTGEEGPVFD